MKSWFCVSLLLIAIAFTLSLFYIFLYLSVLPNKRDIIISGPWLESVYQVYNTLRVVKVMCTYIKGQTRCLNVGAKEEDEDGDKEEKNR